MAKIKTPITDAFIKWLKKATEEDLKKIRDDANNFAPVLGTRHKLQFKGVTMKVKDLVIDNMPLNANPLYDCSVDAKPVVFKPGDMCGKMIAGRKSKDKRKYTVPLYPITMKTFNQVSSFLQRNMLTHGYWGGGAVLCLQGNKIGLAFHNSAVKKREHNEE